jgi:hypothetical protein
MRIIAAVKKMAAKQSVMRTVVPPFACAAALAI